MIKVLHVEDRADDFEIIKWQLQRLASDISLDWAESADQALKLLNKKDYDCILCDYQMPGMNGLELLEALRARRIEKAFIFLTGQGSEDIATEAFRSGVDDYFTKNDGIAHYDRLLNSIRRVVESRRQQIRREDAEKAKRWIETKYRALFENIKDVVFICSPDWDIIETNPCAEEFFGCPQSCLHKSRLNHFFSHHGEFRRLNNHLRKEGYVKDVEVGFKCRDGRIKTGLISVSVQTTGESGISGYNGMIRDVTAIKMADEERTKSEDRFKSLVDKAVVGIATTNTRGIGVYVNDALCKMMGYSREELVGKHFVSFLHPEDKRKIMRIFWSAFIDSRQDPYLQFRVNHKKGHTVYMECRPTVFWHKNKILGFHGLIIDVTERINTKEKIQAARDRLADLRGKLTAATHELLKSAAADHQDSRESIMSLVRHSDLLLEEISGITERILEVLP